MSLVGDAVSVASTPLKPYLLAIKIAVIAGAATLVAFLSWRVHVDAQQIGALKVTVAQAKLDNISDLSTINQLKQANEQWVLKDQANEVAINELSSQLVSNNDALVVSRRDVTQQQTAEVSPQQIALRNIRIDTADFELVQRLRRESAANSH